MATKKDTLTINKPSFDYFSASNFAKLEAKTQTAEREVDRFKNDYSSSRLNKVYEKYELFEEEKVEEQPYTEQFEPVHEKPIIRHARQNVDSDFTKIIREQNNFNEVEETFTYTKVDRDPRVRLDLNKRTRLAVITYSFVAIMMMFLLVYNAFAISNVNSNISNLNSNIATEQVRIDRAIKDIGNMTDQTNIIDVATDLNFGAMPTGDVVSVSLYEKQAVVIYEGQTNWFDSICGFVTNVFGG